MTKLPVGWEIKRLDEIADVVMGQSPPGSSYNERGEGQPFFQGKTEFGEVHPTVRKYTTAGTKFAMAGDILMSVRAPVGPTNIADIDCVIGRGLAAIRAKSVVSQSYLRWTLKHLEIDIQSKGTGTTFDAITGETLRGTLIALPPLAEQQEIVALLEDHLSRLDAVLADVKQAKIKAAQFRRSFIHEMTTSIEGSEVMGILDICDVYQPKTISTKELISDGKFPVYGANGQIGFYDKFNHEESEVTVTCRGATCGTVNVIPARSWITGNAMVFNPRDNRIQKGFLEYVLRGMDWTPVITGTAQPQITRTSMQDVYVNVPSPEKQREIYMKLESSLTQVTSAELLSEKVEKQGASLRRSLLQAAFTGQLTNEVVSV
jgi:type I restriction enzyme S subunit